MLWGTAVRRPGNIVTDFNQQRLAQFTNLFVNSNYNRNVRGWLTAISREDNARFIELAESRATRRVIVDNTLAGEYDHPEFLSLLFLAHQVGVYHGLAPRFIENMRIREGNQAIAERIREMVSVRHQVIMNSRVTAIERVSTNTNGSSS